MAWTRDVEGFSMDQLDEFERLAQEASEGPWAVDPLDIGTCFNVELPNGDPVAMAGPITGDQNHAQRRANAQFIAALNPTVVQALISQLQAAMKR